MFVDLDAVKPATLEFPLCGTTYSIPTIDALPAETALDIVERGASRGEMVQLFRGVLDQHAPDALKRMTTAQLMALLDAWKQTGDVGESSPSSD